MIAILLRHGITEGQLVIDEVDGEGDFMDKASSIFGGAQTISQLRKNQNIILGNKTKKVNEYFNCINKGVLSLP